MKCYVVIGLLGGLPSDDPQVFIDKKDADAASAKIDKDLGIVRDEEGRYDSDNDSYLYEVELKL